MSRRAPTEHDRPRRRSALARAGLVLLGLAGAFGLCELAFRVVERVRRARAGELWAVYDEALGWRLNPKYGDHNAQGLRDRPIEPKAGRWRLLMLGDSVLYYGDSVDDTVVGHLRRDLASHRRPGSTSPDVINAGAKGYTNWQELEFLKQRGLALEPDLVGVAFVLNDCPRMLHQFRVEDGRIVGQNYDFSEEVVGEQPLLYRLLRQSRFLVWLRHRFASVEAVPKDGYTFEHRPDFASAWREDAWPAVEEQLRELRDFGRAHSIPVFLVVFPFGDQYRKDYLERDRARVLFPQRRLREICERLGVPYFDLFLLLNHSDFLEDGIHLTPVGRKEAAAAIAAFLVEMKLLPPR